MKKGIWILLFLCVSLPLKAQDSKELIEILLDFCQQVTQEEPSEEKIYAIFQSISPEKKYLLLEEKKSSFAGFTQEKVAYIDLDKEKYNNTKLISYKREAECAYTLDLFLYSPYSIKAGKVSYEKAIYPISFPELTEKLGRVFYDPIFQAKDTKRSNYIYQNPQTHKKAVFSILSYNPPEAPYNIIYRIEIEDIRFFDEASLRKGKFYMKRIQKYGSTTIQEKKQRNNSSQRELFFYINTLQKLSLVGGKGNLFYFLAQNTQQIINIDEGIMRIFLILISILLFSCEESKKVKSNFTKNTFVTENERIKVNDSLPLLKDFLLLEDELLQKDLFKKIDSVSAIHYPMYKKKDIVNITPEMLDRYLYDINRLDLKDSIISYDITKKEYHHKMIHREMQKYKTSDYKNIIYVEAYPNKTFRLVINYSYTVQFGKGEEPISVESSISYSFKIINRKIAGFDIQESG